MSKKKMSDKTKTVSTILGIFAGILAGISILMRILEGGEKE